MNKWQIIKGTIMTRAQWEQEAERILSSDYGIGLIDCTPDGRAPDDWQEQTPALFAERVALSYDLDKVQS